MGLNSKLFIYFGETVTDDAKTGDSKPHLRVDGNTTASKSTIGKFFQNHSSGRENTLEMKYSYLCETERQIVLDDWSFRALSVREIQSTREAEERG